MKEGEHFGLSSDIEFPCPFCGRGVRASVGGQGRAAGVMHIMPMCETFDRLEPHEFLNAARLETEKKERL